MVLRPGLFSLRILGRLQDAAGDVGVRRRLDLLDEAVNLLAEVPLLLVGHARTIVEGDLGDDVLLAEAAGVDARDRERIARVELGQDRVDQGLGLVELLGVGARGVDQQVDTAGGRCGLAGAAGERQRERGQGDRTPAVHDSDSLTLGVPLGVGERLRGPARRGL